MSGALQLADYIYSIESISENRFTTFSWHVIESWLMTGYLQLSLWNEIGGKHCEIFLSYFRTPGCVHAVKFSLMSGYMQTNETYRPKLTL